jgi:hypothetical protein
MYLAIENKMHENLACNTEVTVSATSRLISRGVAQQPEDLEAPGPYKPSRTNI